MLDHPGAIRVPTGAPKWPKTAPKWLEWLKITKMALHYPKWPWNTSNGYITWLYVMLDHPGPFSEAHRDPIMTQNITKNGPLWPKMALHDPKCLCMTPNSPKTLPMGILHETLSCWTTLGPFQRPTGPQNDPKKHQNGPLLPKIALFCPKWPFTTLNNASMKSLHDPKCPFMTQNVPAWPEMTLKHFSGA